MATIVNLRHRPATRSAARARRAHITHRYEAEQAFLDTIRRRDFGPSASGPADEHCGLGVRFDRELAARSLETACSGSPRDPEQRGRLFYRRALGEQFEQRRLWRGERPLGCETRGSSRRARRLGCASQRQASPS